MAGKPWTEAELQFVRENYVQLGGAVIADRLGRSRSSVYQVAANYGLRRILRMAAEEKEQLRELHAEGLTDADIARRMGWDRRRISWERARLGLSVNSESVKAVLRDNVKKQCKTLGIRHGGDLRALAYRRYAVENGWPANLRPREVQILNTLADRGVPMTRLELAEAIGMRTDRIGGNGRPALLTDSCRSVRGQSACGTYTATLIRDGYLRSVGRASGDDYSTAKTLYFLGPKALEILNQRSQSCKTENANDTNQ